MHGARNVRGGLILLFLGVAGGLVMAVYAFEPLVTPSPGFTRYDDLPRRLIRLAHIAAVMLPLINVVLGPWLDRLALPAPLASTASWLLLGGAMGLPASLVLEALIPSASALHASAAPAVVFVGGLGVVAFGAWRTDFMEEAAHASPGHRGTDRQADRGDALQGFGGRAHARHTSS
jgi:hypothetical protein